MHNDLIWNIHVKGLANLITERQGECDLPPVLCNFLILSVYLLLRPNKANRSRQGFYQRCVQLPFGVSQENY